MRKVSGRREARAWARFRRQHGAAVPRPPGCLRRTARAAWGLALGAAFMLAWAVVLVLAVPLAILAAPVLWAGSRLRRLRD